MNKIRELPNPRRNLLQTRMLSAFLIFSWLMAACGSNQQAPVVGDSAPDFTLTSTEGTSFSLSDYKGKQPVLLYFHMAVG